MPGMMDDKLDNYWPQGSTQWDAICHFGTEAPSTTATVKPTSAPGAWASTPPLARHRRSGRAPRRATCGSKGSPIDPDSSFEIMPDLLDATAAARGIDLRGDILCLRTGWVGWYLGLDAERPPGGCKPHPSTCAAPASATARAAEYLWDHGVAAVAADNPTVEVMPPPSPASDPALTDPSATLPQVMGKLGMTLGEFFDFDDLADDCGRRHLRVLLRAAPINVTGGVEPTSAVIVK
jgi:hypothetical protein